MMGHALPRAAVEEFGQLDLSHETKALAVFFLGGGQLCFCSNAPDFRLFQFTNGEQRVGKLSRVT